MVQTSKPWNLTTPGDAGPYSAEQWAAYWRSTLIGNFASNYNRGVLARTGDAVNSPLVVTVTSPATNQVRVYPGEAIVAGWHYISDAQELLTIASNLNPNPRVTTIVLRLVAFDQQIRLVAKDGAAAASPVAPTLTQDITTTFEIPLADITVPAGYDSSIDAISSGVTDRRLAGIMVPLEHGGVNIDGLASPYTKGQIAIANSASEMVQSPALINYGAFVGHTSNDGNVNVVSQRPHKLRGPNSATWALVRPANSTSGTRIPINTSDIVNPDGYITQVAGNLYRLESGSYLVNAAIGIGNDGGAGYAVQTWIANSAAPTIHLVESMQLQIPAFVTSGAPVIPAPFVDGLLESTGAEDFELRFRSFSANGASNLSLNGNFQYIYEISFRKIR